MERWLGASVVQVPNIRAQSMRASESATDQLSATLQTPCKPVWLTGLNTEAELILARAGKFETYFLFNLTLSCTLALCTCALSCTVVVIGQVKIKKVYLFSHKLIYQ